eukprot:gene2824-2052_t
MGVAESQYSSAESISHCVEEDYAFVSSFIETFGDADAETTMSGPPSGSNPPLTSAKAIDQSKPTPKRILTSWETAKSTFPQRKRSEARSSRVEAAETSKPTIDSPFLKKRKLGPSPDKVVQPQKRYTKARELQEARDSSLRQRPPFFYEHGEDLYYGGAIYNGVVPFSSEAIQQAYLSAVSGGAMSVSELQEQDLAIDITGDLQPQNMLNYVQTTVLCFPGLGCSYSYFHSLAQKLHADNLATVYSVCLPQRMERVCEEADQYRLYDVVHAIRDEIVENQLVSLRPDRKLIFYGHSIGGLIAYEICRSLQRTHYHVSCLIVDSIRSPFRQTMFNFSEDPHGLDDHTIATHDTHGNLSRQNTMGAHLSMVPPPKPYYALNFQPIRDASLLPTISSHVSTPAGSVHNNLGPNQMHSSRAPLSRGSSFQDKPAALSRGNSMTQKPSLSRGNSFDDGNVMTTYEQVAADDRELLPSILSELSDKQLQAAIYKLGGLPPLLQKRRDLLRKVVAVFRHDVRWLEEYFISAPVIPGFPYVEKVTVDLEDVHELLQMPPSMFKLHFPVFSIHADMDPWIQNEEVTAWTLTSNSYDHFIVEDANHFHVQHEGFLETLQSLISRIQAQQEDVDDGGTARQLHSGRVGDGDDDGDGDR